MYAELVGMIVITSMVAASIAMAGDLTVNVAEGPSLPHAVAGHVGGMVHGLPVVAGGSSWSQDRKTKTWRHECFIFRDGKWTPGPPLPRGIADAAYAVTSNGLYIAGGTDGKAPLRETYHLAGTGADAQWRALAPLPEGLDGAAGAIVDDTFYVVGGFTEVESSNRLWSLKLNEPNAQWQARAPLPAGGRAFPASVAMGKAVYLFGGFTLPPYQPNAEVFADAHRYDPAADRWEKLKLDLPGYAWTATVIDQRTIMLTGRAPRLSVVTAEILLLDLGALSATPIGRLVTPSCCMPALQVDSNTWWLPGGEPDTNRSRTARTTAVRLQGIAADE